MTAGELQSLKSSVAGSVASLRASALVAQHFAALNLALSLREEAERIETIFAEAATVWTKPGQDDLPRLQESEPPTTPEAVKRYKRLVAQRRQRGEDDLEGVRLPYADL